VDFYGFQDRAARSRADLEANILSGVESATMRCDRRFVLPYVQMHEFEGLLFSDTQAFESVLDAWNDHRRKALESVAKAFASPEDINNSRETAPSKRIERIFEGAYSKTEHGPLIAESIGIEAIRAKCMAFSEWVGKLQTWGNEV